MTDQQPRPPLWRVMDTAFYPFQAKNRVTHGGIRAAEIRAVADAIPEEFYGANGVRAWLLEEARRAEAGEQ